MTEHRDRIVDWQEELRRLEPDLPKLPAAAQRAIREVLERFAIEDAEARAAALAPARSSGRRPVLTLAGWPSLPARS